MSLTHESKFSYQSRHSGPGGRLGISGGPQAAPHVAHRATSLPSLGVPAGFSRTLGNKMGLQAYASLGGTHSAKPRPPTRPELKKVLHSDAYKYESRDSAPSIQGGPEEWTADERLNPADFGPAGGLVRKKNAIKMVPGYSKNQSTVDVVVFGRDFYATSSGNTPRSEPEFHAASSHSQDSALPLGFRPCWTNKGKVLGNPNYVSTMDNLVVGRDFNGTHSGGMALSMARPDFRPPREFESIRQEDRRPRATVQRSQALY